MKNISRIHSQSSTIFNPLVEIFNFWFTRFYLKTRKHTKLDCFDHRHGHSQTHWLGMNSSICRWEKKITIQTFIYYLLNFFSCLSSCTVFVLSSWTDKKKLVRITERKIIELCVAFAMSSIWQNRFNYLLCKTTHLWTRLHVEWTEIVQKRRWVGGTERDTHRRERKSQYTTTMSNALCFYTRRFSLHNHYISGVLRTQVPVRRREHRKREGNRNKQTVNWKQTGNMILIHTFRHSLASFVRFGADCHCWNISFSRCQNIFFLSLATKYPYTDFAVCILVFGLPTRSHAATNSCSTCAFFFSSFPDLFSMIGHRLVFLFFSFLTVCIWYLFSPWCAYFNSSFISACNLLDIFCYLFQCSELCFSFRIINLNWLIDLIAHYLIYFFPSLLV